MLGRLEVDVDECIAIYLKLIGTLFKKKSSFSIGLRGNLKGKFSSRSLKEAINQVACNRGLSKTEYFNDEVQRKYRV